MSPIPQQEDNEPAWFVRRPFPVRCWRVTEENIERVAAWCQGTIIGEGPRRFIRVPVENPRNVRQTEAYLGQWVMRSRHRGQFKFKVYTQAWLDHDFTKMSGGEDYEEDETENVPVLVPAQTRPTPRIIDRIRERHANGEGSMRFKTIEG